MRTLSLFISVFILFSSMSLQSAEREFSDFEKNQVSLNNNNKNPSRDLGPDWIAYDDGEHSKPWKHSETSTLNFYILGVFQCAI